MNIFGSRSEADKLDEVVDELPDRVADWSPAQREAFTTQADRATRERNGVNPDVG